LHRRGVYGHHVHLQAGWMHLSLSFFLSFFIKKIKRLLRQLCLKETCTVETGRRFSSCGID
jgi:hypothetical protein